MRRSVGHLLFVFVLRVVALQWPGPLTDLFFFFPRLFLCFFGRERVVRDCDIVAATLYLVGYSSSDGVVDYGTCGVVGPPAW